MLREEPSYGEGYHLGYKEHFDQIGRRCCTVETDRQRQKSRFTELHAYRQNGKPEWTKRNCTSKATWKLKSLSKQSDQGKVRSCKSAVGRKVVHTKTATKNTKMVVCIANFTITGGHSIIWEHRQSNWKLLSQDDTNAVKCRRFTNSIARYAGIPCRDAALAMMKWARLEV